MFQGYARVFLECYFQTGNLNIETLKFAWKVEPTKNLYPPITMVHKSPKQGSSMSKWPKLTAYKWGWSDHHLHPSTTVFPILRLPAHTACACSALSQPFNVGSRPDLGLTAFGQWIIPWISNVRSNGGFWQLSYGWNRGSFLGGWENQQQKPPGWRHFFKGWYGYYEAIWIRIPIIDHRR